MLPAFTAVASLCIIIRFRGNATHVTRKGESKRKHTETTRPVSVPV